MSRLRTPAGPLRSGNFRLMLACDVISATGTAVATVALPFAVLAIGGSASDVGYVAAAYLVPLIGFLLVGGVVADRLPRHQVMVGANAVEALAQAASAALMLTGQARVWQLAALAAARGVGTGFYFPASSGLLPQTVPADQRAPANAMDRIGRNGGQIGGAALGGVLVGLAGPGWGLAVDAVSFAVAAALRAGMRFPALPSEPRAGMLPELRAGWRDFISRRWLWVIVVQFAFVVAVLMGTTSVLGPLVADAHLGGARSWGLILAADGIGAVLGGFVMIRFRPRRMLLAASLAVPAESVLLLTLAVPLPVPVIAATAFLAGGCAEVFSVNWATTMQQEIPPAMLSRLSSYDALGSFALAPVGTVVAGPLAGAFGTPSVLAAGAILIVVLTIAVLCVPEVRNLERQKPAASGQSGTLAS
ncbi:MAG: MFS transporter [Streptosporangiaceae bacterium]